MSPRAAKVRFYIDADIRRLGIVLAGLRYDVTYPGDPGALIHKRQRQPCPITATDILDEEWITEAARRGWLIATRDSRIGENRGEMAAVRDDGAKMVALNQKDAATKWGQLEVFMTRWRGIEALTRAGPVHLARVAHGADADSPRLTAAPPSASQLS